MRFGMGMRIGMANEALFATAGLFGLFVAMLAGALWDTPMATAPFRAWENFRSQEGTPTRGRHTPMGR